MTSEQADERIRVSERKLAGYVEVALGQRWPVGDLPIIQREIGVLEAVAEEHPGKVNKIIGLVAQWVQFRNHMRTKLN